MTIDHVTKIRNKNGLATFVLSLEETKIDQVMSLQNLRSQKAKRSGLAPIHFIFMLTETYTWKRKGQFFAPSPGGLDLWSLHKVLIVQRASVEVNPLPA